MHACAICGTAGAICGGPSDARPIDEPITLETTMADNDMEMVKVHVDDGTTRGHDRKFTRKDAEAFIAYTPNAQIVEDSVAEAGAAESEGGTDEAEVKSVERAPSNKAMSGASKKAEDK